MPRRRYGVGYDTPEDKRAREAVRKFRLMIPSLTSYARAVSGNSRLRIVIANDNGSSTANTINFKPPIELGDSPRHDDNYCDLRDATGRQMCDACDTHERVMAVIYHEIGHIAFGTHSEATGAAITWAHEHGAKAWNAETDKKINNYVERQISNNRGMLQRMGEEFTYMSLANSIHPYLGKLYNAIEDARVNERIFMARRGVKKMYESLMRHMVAEGVPNPADPSAPNLFWRDMASDMQIMLAILSYLAGDDYEGWYQPEVEADLLDPGLNRRLEEFNKMMTPFQSLRLTVDVMAELQRLGYCKVELSEENSEADSSGGDDQQESEGDGSDSGDGSSSGDSNDDSESSPSAGGKSEEGEESESSSSAGDAQRDDEGSGTEENGDGSEDELVDTGAYEDEDRVKLHTPEDRQRFGGRPEEGKICIVEQAIILEEDSSQKSAGAKQETQEAVERAIIQGMYFETPAIGIEGVKEYKRGAYDYTSLFEYRHGGYRNQLEEIPATVLGNALMEARLAFDANARRKQLANLKSGKVNTRTLGKRAPLDDPRLFKKRIIPGKRDYAVVIGMDISYSTVGENLHIEKEAVLAQAELLSRLGIPFSIYAHSGEGAGGNLLIWEVKGQQHAWDADTKHTLSRIGAVSANLDGHFMEYLRKRADEYVATDKIILYFSDGKMPAENHDEELDVLQREIRTCRQRGYTLLGVGIRTDSPSRHGLETVQIDSATEIKAVVEQLKHKLAVRR